MAHPLEELQFEEPAASFEEERDWNQLTTEQFFKGYADSDAVYDKLPSR